MSAAYYYLIYLIFVSIFTLILYQRYKNKDGNITGFVPSDTPVAFIISIVMTLFIGFRPKSGIYFIDMANTYNHYYALSYGKPFSFDWGMTNILYDNYVGWLGSIRADVYVLFLSIAAIYFICAFLASRKIFPNDTLAAYLVFLAAFSTFSYSTNGIKAGAAASIFLLALAYRDNLIICISLLFVSWGFHHSMQLPLAATLLAFFYRNTKTYIVLWGVCFIMALSHITFFQALFAGITDEAGAEYLAIDNVFVGFSGFRIDFILYSFMPILVAYYVIIKKAIDVSPFYHNLVNIYIITNAIWMLCMYASFTNRIAYLSWLMYPVVLIYPFLNENLGPRRYKIFSIVMILHLGFTLFMKFVYYA